MKQFFSVDEVCAILGISRPTVIRSITTGQLPALRLGGRRARYRIPCAALDPQRLLATKPAPVA